MLTKVTIKDNKNTPLAHVSKLWDNGASWEFKPGVNIIVGENGCGKSTLLKLIASYGLCSRTMTSQMPSREDILSIDHLFDHKILGDDKFRDGCIINMDYNGILFRYSPSIEQKNSDDILGSFESTSLFMNSCRHSMGEGMLLALMTLFDRMNDEKNFQFPINTIKDYAKSSNPVWEKRMKMLLQYYADNQVQVSADDFEYTVLLDEPDRNLDIEHIKELYNILSYHRPMTQLVCVIHNPVLICKLMQTDVHFVEMTPNYLNNVKTFIQWAK